MAKTVIMPKQGLQMTEGTIIKWIVKEGGKAVKNEPLFDMETDKLTITIDAQDSGTLLKIVKGEGETVPITQTIAIVGEPGEDITELLNEGSQAQEEEQKKEPAAAVQPVEATMKQTGGKVLISPRAKTMAQEKGLDYSGMAGSGTDGMIIERDIAAYLESVPAMTPLAKKVAELNNVDVFDVAGSGAHDKIVRADIMKAMQARKQGERKDTIIPFAGMRKVISDHMVQSLTTAAQATHRIKVDMTEATRLRETFKKTEKKISFNDIVAFATCRALKDFPIMNSQITDEGIRLKDYVNLGIAVAIEKGLIVPVVNDADLMTIEELGIMSKEMAGKAKNGQLKPDEYKGGSFTISNLGMFGLDSFVAIINQPESGILAVGKISKTPVVVNDEIVIRPMMELTLTYDHRVVDGAPAAQFLARIKEYLEQPYLLL